MKKRRLKKSVIRKAIILIGTVICIAIIIKTIIDHNTNEYKLKQIGYNKDEINIITTLSEENINYILNSDYNELIDDFKSEKYFLDKNLQTYLDYRKENESLELNTIVSIVNVGANNEWYTNTRESDLSKNELMLVNKYNYLSNDYKPDDVINISSRYAYSDNKTSEKILEHYKEMSKKASEEGINLIISSAFRTYEEQDETYNYYKKTKGEEYANTRASLPGYSEHQTGLAFDILTLTSNTSNFESTEAFTWLQENSYKYGFILRYPKDKENITGYNYESWHYRYVGVDVATIIHNENITFDEYYAYYIEG